MYEGKWVGTMCSCKDPKGIEHGYDKIVVREFVSSALAYMLKGECEIVLNFLLVMLQLQGREKKMGNFNVAEGIMPASFKVRTIESETDFHFEEVLEPDFGRGASVDPGLWWIVLLRAYGKASGDLELERRPEVQAGMKMIVKLCLPQGFDIFPTLLVTDGSCMIDRRMGIYGHPLEVQSLLYSAFLCASKMLAREDGSAGFFEALDSRLVALSLHIREDYWIHLKKLNEIYRYQTEDDSSDAPNKFNIYPHQIPLWLLDWMPDKGGYFIGNLHPAHMDFRFFTLGNLWSIVSNLASKAQSNAILDLMEAKWSDLVADMPLKICFPALEGNEWGIITGSDPKNTPWSHHNAGSWPTLLWQFTVACITMGRAESAAKAVEIAEKRLAEDNWPEYYDTKRGSFIGKGASLFQTCSVAGYLVSKQLLKNHILTCILIEEEVQDLQLAGTLNAEEGQDLQSAGTLNEEKGQDLQSAGTLNDEKGQDLQSAGTLIPEEGQNLQLAGTQIMEEGQE